MPRGHISCPHKVSFKAVTLGKDPLAKVSKRKSKTVNHPRFLFQPLPPRDLGRLQRRYTSLISRVLYLLSQFLLPESHLSYSFRSMACARGLFLRWSECEESRAASEVDKISLEKRLSEVIRKRDEARAQADHFKAQAFDFNNKHADIQSVCAGLVKSKSNLSSKQERELIVFNSSLEEAAVHIKEFQSQNRDTRKLLAGSLEELRWRPLPELLWQTLRRVKIKRTFLWMTPSPS
ncbi:hypothetical protein LIER_15917 [Lithospermum erythrorhizon]|uniref:Uncharacterized protein n=1 Tax=Lithospermum erythrorhizon TaxID=34254 RepID=A0AAV3Q8T0_LITER